MASLLRRRIRRILFDVDTQFDLLKAGQGDNGQLLRNIRRLVAWARLNNVPVISTALSRRSAETTGKSNGHTICVEGTPGQQKIHHTILPNHRLFGPENCTDLPRQLFSKYQQIIFEKRIEDPFEQARAERLLSEIKIDDFIVFGTNLEVALKYTALGLLHRKKKVTLVTDAILGATERDSNLALRQIEAKGAKLVTTESLTGKSSLRGQPHPHLAHVG